MDEDGPSSPPDEAAGGSGWPTVSADRIGVADFTYDLAYMGVYARLKIRNSSPYLLREAELRIDGRGQTVPKVVTSRTVLVGPLFPGEAVPAEQGIGDRAGISGLHFEEVAARAVPLTPPHEMVPASTYPGLVAEVVSVTEDEWPDLRDPAGDAFSGSPTTPGIAIRIRVSNDGPAVIERARLRLLYFSEAGGTTQGQDGPPREPEWEWIFDVPHADWNPYRVPDAPGATYALADPLPPSGVHEFAVIHYYGGPVDWARCLDATSVEVLEIKLRA
jgi:hypothetical protein